MEPYIKKDAIVAEIDRRINELSQLEKASYEVGLSDAYKIVLSFLDTLEVKEVDLDLEITLWANAIPEIRLDDVERLAKYFFELGLKAQKGE